MRVTDFGLQLEPETWYDAEIPAKMVRLGMRAGAEPITKVEEARDYSDELLGIRVSLNGMVGKWHKPGKLLAIHVRGQDVQRGMSIKKPTEWGYRMVNFVTDRGDQNTREKKRQELIDEAIRVLNLYYGIDMKCRNRFLTILPNWEATREQVNVVPNGRGGTNDVKITDAIPEGSWLE